MRPAVRKAALVAHVIASVGWLGAIAAFLALAAVGLTSGDPERVRAADLAESLLGTRVLVPLALLALATGVVQAIGTPWGLVRHWWVLFKLGITLLAALGLAVHTLPMRWLAEGAVDDLHALRVQLAADATAALGLLVVNTVLSVYKPRGLTPWSR